MTEPPIVEPVGEPEPAAQLPLVKNVMDKVPRNGKVFTCPFREATSLTVVPRGTVGPVGLTGRATLVPVAVVGSWNIVVLTETSAFAMWNGSHTLTAGL